MDLASYGVQNFEVSSRVLENLWTLDVHHNNQFHNCITNRCVTYTIAQYIDE
jgi:hypothetical protein